MTARLGICLAAAAVIAAPLAARAGPPPPVAVELTGWLVLDAVAGLGALDAVELPRAAAAQNRERTFTMSVRQSRLGVDLGLPDDGRLGGARLHGLVEGDFAGGSAGGDDSTPLPRLRQAWVSAAWEAPVHPAVLAGQADGLLGGPHTPETLGHLAVPRFAGAGVLHRRAPQLRLSVEAGGELGVGLAVAALAPLDRNTAAVPTSSAPTGVGVRSGLPDLEGRVSLAWRPGGGQRLELGLSGHGGREVYVLDGVPGRPDGRIDAWGAALDLRLELGRFVLAGAAWAGQNLDVYDTAGAGVRTGYAVDPASGAMVLLRVNGVRTSGAWGQVQWRAADGLVLLAGAGLERPRRADLPTGSALDRNLQASGGALLDLTGRLRAGLELTGFWTRTTAAAASHSTQIELVTRYAF